MNLIFDCDGVLADTERYGHLPAFNATFERFGLPVRWTEEEYGRKLRIGGGKERMASLFADPSFAAAVGAADRTELLLTWHKAKTAAFKQLVADGRIPPRPGIARIIHGALDAGWTVAVASTSAEESVRAVLANAVGPTDIPVFAGDIVPAKKPDPAIYELTVERLRLEKEETLVVEDSRNGLLAATGAGLRVPGDGERLHPGRGLRRVRPRGLGTGRPRPAADRGAGQSGRGESRRLPHAGRPACVSGDKLMSIEKTELVVRTIAETAIENEKYFGDLDSVVGDGDFGYSLARGFEKLLEGWDDLDRTDAGTFLKRTGMVIASRIGGTSGPIWGTAFMRAGGAAGDAEDPTVDQVVAMLRAAIEGIKARGQSDVGDKTLLDALVPFTDSLEATSDIHPAAAAARKAADATIDMVAKRGRAAYTGERSRGSVDAGAMAVAVLAERISEIWPTQGASS